MFDILPVLWGGYGTITAQAMTVAGVAPAGRTEKDVRNGLFYY
jgi:hypothetical protein